MLTVPVIHHLQFGEREITMTNIILEINAQSIAFDTSTSLLALPLTDYRALPDCLSSSSSGNSDTLTALNGLTCVFLVTRKWLFSRGKTD